MNTRLRAILGQAAKLAALASVVSVVALAAVIGDRRVGAVDPYAQSTFACHEDEALMYAPAFGSDRVGCVNVEEINTR